MRGTFAVAVLWITALASANTTLQGVSEVNPVPGDTTLVDSVDSGSVLIRTLPTTLQEDSVVSYRALRIPAMGWLRDRSFFWRTPSDGEGNYRFRFEAELASGARETVEIRVFLTPTDGG